MFDFNFNGKSDAFDSFISYKTMNAVNGLDDDENDFEDNFEDEDSLDEEDNY